MEVNLFDYTLNMEKFIPKLKGLFLWLPLLGYIITGIVILPLQLGTYILVKPWSLWVYRKISYYFSLLMYWHPTFLTAWWSGSSIQIFVSSTVLHNHLGKEHSLILLNHRYETEIFTMMTIVNYFECLGNARAFAKKSVQYLPIAGWLWKLQEHIFLERNFEKDRKIITKSIESLIKHNDAVSIILFPEGTRFTEEKHKASMIVAEEKGMPKLKHHLLPRLRGFMTCLETLKNEDKIEFPVVIYDALLVMERSNSSFSMLNLLRGHGQRIKLLLRRYPVKDIPDDELGCANWLLNIYQEKDEFMENCLETGTFVGNSGDPNGSISLEGYELITVPKPYNVLVIIGGWNVICLVGILYKIIYVLGSGNILQTIGFVSITMIGCIVFRILSYSMQTETGSLYGINSKKLTKLDS